MPQSVLLFSYLPLLDVMSTMAFLALGIHEGNPIVRFAFSLGPNPIAGMLVVKVLAVLLAIRCWQMGRDRLLFRTNLLFALLVA